MITVRFTHKCDTKNFAVYSADPQGIVVQNVLYASINALKTDNGGVVPATLTMTLKAGK